MRAAVTGAFGFSGQYIARRLLDGGHEVITLSGSGNRSNPFGEKVRAFPFHFDQPAKLAESLRGCDVLINTYWMRFSNVSAGDAVANSKTLFQAAKDAAVRRIVLVSITNPDIHSDLPYFRGKAAVEAALEETGIPHCILRPAVLFGDEDILINNIAWSLRYLPVFGVFGRGDYKLQPIYVDDLAAAAVEKAGGVGNEIVNAIGPETFTYRQLVETIRRELGLRRLIVGVPPAMGYWVSRAMGLLMHDVVMTREELRGLMEGRLHAEGPALGTTKLSEWVAEHRETLGRRYASEMARRR